MRVSVFGQKGEEGRVSHFDKCCLVHGKVKVIRDLKSRSFNIWSNDGMNSFKGTSWILKNLGYTSRR